MSKKHGNKVAQSGEDVHPCRPDLDKETLLGTIIETHEYVTSVYGTHTKASTYTMDETGYHKYVEEEDDYDDDLPEPYGENVSKQEVFEDFAAAAAHKTKYKGIYEGCIGDIIDDARDVSIRNKDFRKEIDEYISDKSSIKPKRDQGVDIVTETNPDDDFQP